MSNKNENKRKEQALKIVKKDPAKRDIKTNGKMRGNTDPDLKDQYLVIRDDLVKLREDLARGYDMAKDWIEKNRNVRDLLRAK